MKHLYFIAAVPPSPLQDSIEQVKQLAAERFHSSRALNAPAHITLVSPFRLSDEEEQRMGETLAQVAYEHAPFEVELKDYAFFEPRVVFINVMPNEALDRLRTDLWKHLEAQGFVQSQSFTTEYHPHITVAFRDLSPQQFALAKEYFAAQQLEATFQVADLCLLKHHGQKWFTHQVYRLNPKIDLTKTNKR